jgi:fatty-acyl-CoA synthase
MIEGHMGRTVFIEATTLGDLLDRRAASGAPAVVFPDVRVTYGELAQRSDHFARALRALGVGRGDKVGILLPNCLDFVVALFAAAKLGAIAVPVNGRFRTHELSQIIAHADIAVLVTAAGPAGTVDYPDLIAQVFPELAAQDPRALRLDGAPCLRQVVDLGSAGAPGLLDRAAFESGAGQVAPDEVTAMQERVRVRDVALLMYTSGTTSNPKGCLLTHEALVRHGRNVAINRFWLTAEDRFWDPLPLFHIGGIVPMLGCFAVGATYYHAGHFDATQALDTLERERITVAYPAFETIWLGVLNHPRFPEADLSALRLIQNIAVPERLVQMQKALPGAIEVSSFGSTESSSNLTLTLPDDDHDARMNTLGHPLPGIEIRIADHVTGEACAAGEVGELLFRGYSLFEGYYKEPELTAAAIDPDGWFHSGDLATMDAAGRLIYSGRLKDMLKVGGENVSAVEVESFLAAHPAVDIVNVVGAPDARYDEVPAAFVQLKPGATLAERELIDFCIGRIATYKIPRYVRVVDEWPMSGTKIQKFVLREQIAAELRERGITEAPKLETRTAV